MSNIIELYRNPVFGVMILFAIVLVIVIMDSVRGAYAKKKKKEYLEQLSKNFDSFSLQQNISDFMQHVKNPATTVMRIAEIYFQVGNYQQTIAMCQMLNENTSKSQEKIEVLQMLAKSYYKAGFLQRAKSVLIDILRIYPYNIDALNLLIKTCESLGEYKESLSALDCLEELQDRESLSDAAMKNKIIQTRDYIKAMQIISNTKLSLISQQEQLLDIYHKDSKLSILILRHFKLYNIALFWKQILHYNDIYSCIDLLWHFDLEEIPFDLIPMDSDIRDIYRAKGYIKDYRNIKDITLESLQLLHLHSNTTGDLDFSYYCNSCGVNTPFYSYRCASCDEIDEIKLRFVIIAQT
ncbi:hypothetical protein LS73_009080 [Helicobacter muridarum]|uniref:Putative inner membrane protein n=1 Tax=Helicobacter muridarum TaxID=216 RepID=A0A377PVF6_9HELI|nr:tetratricopeptide repeat protein [Helicobacter muridarum]TLD98344.1 hypothetical protein LS73_009080 [Helicobacter muridarum]STQ86490.1 putative inner membrane protein [Helicobacter muridarum]